MTRGPIFVELFGKNSFSIRQFTCLSLDFDNSNVVITHPNQTTETIALEGVVSAHIFSRTTNTNPTREGE